MLTAKAKWKQEASMMMKILRVWFKFWKIDQIIQYGTLLVSCHSPFTAAVCLFSLRGVIPAHYLGSTSQQSAG
jgi:hypothetical protein